MYIGAVQMVISMILQFAPQLWQYLQYQADSQKWKPLRNSQLKFVVDPLATRTTVVV